MANARALQCHNSLSWFFSFSGFVSGFLRKQYENNYRVQFSKLHEKNFKKPQEYQIKIEKKLQKLNKFHQEGTLNASN